MGITLRNGYKFVDRDVFFGDVKGIEVDNVYDDVIYRRAVQTINENAIEYYMSGDYDLSILVECPSIKYIRVSAEATLNTLIGLKNLKGVVICGLFGENEKFDFRQLNQIEQLAMRGSSKNRTWLEMEQLKKLWVEPFFDKDLKNLRYLQKLVSLSLEGGKLITLDGIENLQQLQEFEIGYFGKLKNIEALKLLKNLFYLRVSDCDHIENLEEVLGSLKTIKELRLLNVFYSTRPRIKDLQFIKKMNSLESFISNYVVGDKDLTPLLNLKNADIFEERKGYNLKNSMLPKSKMV